MKNELGNMSAIQITIPTERIVEFRTILSRALNTWAEAPFEWKELSDIFEHGYPLQDYLTQQVNLVTQFTKNKHGV